MRTPARAAGPRPSSPAARAPATPPAAAADSDAPEFTARLVRLEGGLYAVNLAEEIAGRDAVGGLGLPAIHFGAVPGEGAELEITDSVGAPRAWLDGGNAMLLVKSPPEGGAALITAYLPRDPEVTPVELRIRRIDAAPGPPEIKLSLGSGVGIRRVRLDVVAHIRGRGDLRFADPLWVGRTGPGQWIEGFAIAPRDHQAAAAIEYKGLTASGSETPWLAAGSLCGTRAMGTPLIGFAVRQKAGLAGPGFDCEYAGYFESGATAGPLRNGAPCRSPRDNDPLEGIQVRITPRPPRPAPPKPE